jgi:hypothetical protein
MKDYLEGVEILSACGQRCPRNNSGEDIPGDPPYLPGHCGSISDPGRFPDLVGTASTREVGIHHDMTINLRSTLVGEIFRTDLDEMGSEWYKYVT